MYILASSKLWILALKPVLSHYFEVMWPKKFHFYESSLSETLLLATERAMTNTFSNATALMKALYTEEKNSAMLMSYNKGKEWLS